MTNLDIGKWTLLWAVSYTHLAMIGMKDVSKIKSISDIKMVNSKSEESKRISELINCILELSECNLALLEEFSSMKKTLIELKSIDVDKDVYKRQLSHTT